MVGEDFKTNYWPLDWLNVNTEPNSTVSYTVTVSSEYMTALEYWSSVKVSLSAEEMEEERERKRLEGCCQYCESPHEDDCLCRDEKDMGVI